MVQLIFYSLIGGLLSLIGGLLLLWRVDLAQKITTSLLAFAAGAFLGVSFLDVLPEALDGVSDPRYIFSAVIVGFVGFFMIERYLMSFHRVNTEHSHSAHTESLPFLIILGDSLHNFLDGILIALAYISNPVLGFITALGVAAHEIPQEIGDFSILLSQGWSRKKVILVNIYQSLLTIPGVIIGFYAGRMLESSLPYLLAGTAGVFIYIAASDLIPEIHHRTGHRQFYRVVLPLVLSVALIWFLVEITVH